VKVLLGETLPEGANVVASGKAYDEVFGVPWCASWWWHRKRCMYVKKDPPER
jgi:hypothetical protein